ncbi:sigma-70 family RNA polymerase sigma factor [Sphingopyxis sp. PAMC25046]|uniref:ECF-type sigma factor n=1 Tax=Sphingopyxis sp. PAMC25046 TaxID=2565556 RepID=UPI00109DF181|nr:ECF-type sigma factor [Sphingopyxis sp. PAMC25046]QCB55611.1 sigma-70 family RNA polymerase sigma factor [Sphingopyxis sp. PAMC25046]
MIRTNAIMETLYDDLRDIARRERFRAGQPMTLQTTAVLHEAYIKLYKREDWESREHFLGTAATAIRHVLVNAALARKAAKRGDGVRAMPIGEAHDIVFSEDDRELIALGEALEELAALDAELAKLIDCRFFAGLSEAETADVMGISERTVRRRWTQARAWVHREMAGE